MFCWKFIINQLDICLLSKFLRCKTAPSIEVIRRVVSGNICRDESMTGNYTRTPWVGGRGELRAAPPLPVGAVRWARPDWMARRKISLPWFRQGSTPQLTRQHTIDTPGSWLQRQGSSHQVWLFVVCLDLALNPTHPTHVDTGHVTPFWCHTGGPVISQELSLPPSGWNDCLPSCVDNHCVHSPEPNNESYRQQAVCPRGVRYKNPVAYMCVYTKQPKTLNVHSTPPNSHPLIQNLFTLCHLFELLN